MEECTCNPDNKFSCISCKVHSPLPEIEKYMLTSEEINQLIYAEMEGTCEEFPRPDPRPDVEALFSEVLGDNTAHESVKRLIDGVVALIRKREGY